ncbi:hypothetical protein [Marivita sp.]
MFLKTHVPILCLPVGRAAIERLIDYAGGPAQLDGLLLGHHFL